MVAYAIVDVHVHDIAEFLAYQERLLPLLEAAGGRYLARGGEHRVIAGEAEPGRLMLIEFPSLEALEGLYSSDAYLALGPLRNACCRCTILAVQGLGEGRIRPPGAR